MMNQSIPEDADWSFYGTRDIEFAYSKFHGKSVDEMLSFVRSCPTSAYGYLEVMPAKPFQYYIQSFVQLLDPSSREFAECEEKGSLASCFLSLIDYKLKNEPECILPVIEELMPLAKFISANQKLYDAELDIFGSFEERFEILDRRCKECDGR